MNLWGVPIFEDLKDLADLFRTFSLIGPAQMIQIPEFFGQNFHIYFTINPLFCVSLM